MDGTTDEDPRRADARRVRALKAAIAAASVPGPVAVVGGSGAS